MSFVLSKTTNGSTLGASQSAGPQPPRWPSYGGVSSFVGTSASGKATVYVDPNLGIAGLQNATDLLADADRIITANDTLFGSTGGPVQVIIFALGGHTDGNGGADHAGCDFESGADIEVCASFGKPKRVSALFEAELSECTMGGNLCGVSTGEALSRWCAAAVSNNALADFASAPTWYRQGKKDFVNKTDPTDRNSVSTGCGMAFLSWLISRGAGLDQIAQAMVGLGEGGTLATLYSQLTSEPAIKAWPMFRAAINALPHGVTDDDPFGAMSHLHALSRVESSGTRLAEQLIAAILAETAAGSSPAQLAASIRAILDGDALMNSIGIPGSSCSHRSRRLQNPN